MSLIMLEKKHPAIPKETFLIGSEAENPLPLRTKDGPWSDIAGLTWMFVEDFT